jgi:threonine/homoserine/homoserine lactone efflux protein
MPIEFALFREHAGRRVNAMTAAGLMVFAGTLGLAAITPGPATMTVLGRVLARGPRSAIGFSAGLVIGDLVWLAIAALGLAAIAARAEAVMLAINYAGAAYLVVLAHGFWTAPVGPAAAAPASARTWGIVQGLALQLGNPKVVLFYVALLPALVPVRTLTAVDFALLSVVVAIVVAAVNATYVAFAVAARRMAESHRARRILNRISAGVMVVAAGFLVASAL